MNLDWQLQQIIEELLAHGISLDLAKKEFEKKYIVGAVKRSSGNLGRAASSLGIHRNTLRNKVGILNIRLPREKRASPRTSPRRSDISRARREMSSGAQRRISRSSSAAKDPDPRRTRESKGLR